MTTPIWRPDGRRIEAARMTAFMRRLAAAGELDARGYAELHAWSVRRPGEFWREIWEFCGVIGHPGDRALVDGHLMPGARWFPDARLNFAENLLRRHDAAPAIIYRREDGRRRELTFQDLHAEVAALRSALQRAGLCPGDRVVAWLPNVPEAVIGMLATTALGGIWSSCSPDFGVEGVIDRFGQIEPKILIASDGYSWKGKWIDNLGRLAEIAGRLPTLERTIVVSGHVAPPSLAIPNAATWEEFIAGEAVGTIPPAAETSRSATGRTGAAGASSSSIPFDRGPFDRPVYILFSSGTTGKPKCIVHGTGGTLLQHLKEHQLHTDLREGDRLFYFTTTGWMMWNWLVTGLASGATIVLFDGNPFHPGPAALMELAESERVTAFGVSAKYIDALAKTGYEPGVRHDLSSMRVLLSTGSPLAPESFDWIHRSIKQDVHIASISGGTDIVSGFVLGCPILPVYRGQIQGPGLGMAVDVFGPDGRPLRGEPGELVCTAPFPSMPVGFWNDPDGRKYRAAYFDHFPGVWRHGDWAMLTNEGGVIITGRSDATLNPGGVRIGTAEIYRLVEQIHEVEESIVVGQDWKGDQRIVLFVRLRAGESLTPELAGRITACIRSGASPRHVPARILQVPDIPRTRSGKISEIAVREMIHGREVANVEALANPEALEAFRDRPELAT